MLPRNKSLFLLFFLGLLLLSSDLCAQDQNIFLKFYQDNISSVDGDRCSMHPSCSQYASEVFSKHGFAIGWMMTCDRLIRCGRDEVSLSSKIQIQDQTFIHDPVSANDAWWFLNQDQNQDQNQAKYQKETQNENP